MTEGCFLFSYLDQHILVIKRLNYAIIEWQPNLLWPPTCVRELKTVNIQPKEP